MAHRFTGKERWLKTLGRMGPETRAALKGSLEKSAGELVAAQRALVPVDDGTLRASIRTEPGPHELAINVTAGGPTTTRPVRQGTKATYDYALAQEFGTRKMPANSFFYSVYRLQRKRIVARAKRAASQAAKKAAGS